jgi:hypothetical protein
VGASAYFIAGAGASVAILKCVRSDARVIKYVGPSISLGVGFGAMVSVRIAETKSTNNYFSEVQSDHGDVFATFNETKDLGDDVDGALLLSKTTGGGDSQDNANQSLNLGLEVGIGSVNPGLAIRSFNGRSRWQIILNQLN